MANNGDDKRPGQPVFRPPPSRKQVRNRDSPNFLPINDDWNVIAKPAGPPETDTGPRFGPDRNRARAGLSPASFHPSD